MQKHYFLGQAANYTRKDRLYHTFCIGTKHDSTRLVKYLARKYKVPANHVALTKNGRSALTIALEFTIPKGSKVIINAFTCYAVYEAVKAAGMKPVYADIDPETLNFTKESIEKVLDEDVKAIIVQNTLGNPAPIKDIEKIAKKNKLKIIEDLAHCVGMKYPDGREAGQVGIAAAFSFGKDKVIDTISGGAVLIRDEMSSGIKAPKKLPKFSDTFRARFYPFFGGVYRGLTHTKLATPWMGALLKLRFVEKSADNKLDIRRRPTHFEAKSAYRQFKNLSKKRNNPVRTYYFVKDREEVLKKLKKAGYYFDGFWYEKPISPARYYKQIKFKESDYPNAVEVSKTIINFPTYYKKADLAPAEKIIEEYLINKEGKKK